MTSPQYSGLGNKKTYFAARVTRRVISVTAYSDQCPSLKTLAEIRELFLN